MINEKNIIYYREEDKKCNSRFFCILGRLFWCLHHDNDTFDVYSLWVFLGFIHVSKNTCNFIQYWYIYYYLAWNIPISIGSKAEDFFLLICLSYAYVQSTPQKKKKTKCEQIKSASASGWYKYHEE